MNLNLKLLLPLVLLVGCSEERTSSQSAAHDVAIAKLNHGMSLTEVEGVMGGPGIPVPGQAEQFKFPTATGNVIIQFGQGHFVHVVEVKP